MSTATTEMKPIAALPSSDGNGRAVSAVKPIKGLPVKPKRSGEAEVLVKPIHDLPSLCADLQELNRQRVHHQKSRIMLSNRLAAAVAISLGYHAGMEEADRKERFGAARKIIKSVRDDPAYETEKNFIPTDLILAATPGIDAFQFMEDSFEKQMVKLAEQLPVVTWVVEPEQRGFGLPGLAVIIGEAGDLSNYPNPGMLWARMGCAPFESKNKMLQGSTWMTTRYGSLSAEEWEKYGYCPRRRAVIFVITDSLLRQNKGPYKQRYEQKKAEAIARGDPAWTPECKACCGKGQTKTGMKCKKCSGRGFMQMRPHRHGQLLAGKLLLKNLWIEWNGDQ